MGNVHVQARRAALDTLILSMPHRSLPNKNNKLNHQEVTYSNSAPNKGNNEKYPKHYQPEM